MRPALIIAEAQCYDIRSSYRQSDAESRPGGSVKFRPDMGSGRYKTWFYSLRSLDTKTKTARQVPITSDVKVTPQGLQGSEPYDCRD